jgi:hypothetical protein
MAIVTGGINGPFKGKVGSIYGYTMNGKNIIKGAPRKSVKNKRGSAAQKVNRSKFTQMQQFLHPVLPFIQVGFNMVARSRQMSAHNAAKSYNMLNAFSPEGDIDYSTALVSYGNLAEPLTANVTADDNGLHFSWTNHIDSKNQSNSDQVMLLAYNPEKNLAYYMLSGARRSSGAESLQIWKDETPYLYHIWIAFISDDRQNISRSTYLGEISF